MADDDLSIFEESQEEEIAEGGAANKQAEEAVEAPEQEEAAPAEPEQEEGTGEEEAAPPVAAEETPKTAPLMALLDEREKRQNLERELADYKRREQQRQQEEAAKRAEQPAPDWYENPEQAFTHHLSTYQAKEENRFLNQSQFLAEREYGKDFIAKAGQWVLQNPALRNEVMNHPSPWHAVAEAYKAHEAQQAIGPDPDAWMKAKEEELRAKILAEVQQPSKPRTPPPTMAKAPSAGGNNPSLVDAPDDLQGLFNG